MGFLAPLAAFLGIEVNELIATSKRSALMWGAIGLFGLVAFTFALFAGYLGLSGWIGPIWAALAIAGVSLVVAGIIFATARVTADISHRREVQRRRSAETTALITTAAASALPLLLKSPLLRSIGLPIGATLAALYFASRGDDKPD